MFRPYFRFTRIYSGFKIIKIFHDFKDFIEIPPCYVSVLDPPTIVKGDCFGPTEQSLLRPPPFPKFPNIDRQYFCWNILIPYYQKSISCSLADIGPISKIFKNVSNGSSSFRCPPVPQKLQRLSSTISRSMKTHLSNEFVFSCIIQSISAINNPEQIIKHTSLIINPTMQNDKTTRLNCLPDVLPDSQVFRST